MTDEQFSVERAAALASGPPETQFCKEDEHRFGPCQTCGMPHLASRLDPPTADDIAWAENVLAAAPPRPPAPPTDKVQEVLIGSYDTIRQTEAIESLLNTGQHDYEQFHEDVSLILGYGTKEERMVVAQKVHQFGGPDVDRSAFPAKPPDFWRCNTCGCLWRDNHDDTVSLASAKQTSCADCEMKGSAEACEPLYRTALPAPLTLTDADVLDALRTFYNGCDFTLHFQADGRVRLGYGCYGVHWNLVQGARYRLSRWLGLNGEPKDVQLHPETLRTLKARPPCG